MLGSRPEYEQYINLLNFQAQDKTAMKPKISRDLSRKNTEPAAGRENCGWPKLSRN